MKLCECGCGKEIKYFHHHKYYGLPRYLKGHYLKLNPLNKGKRLSQEIKNKISISLKGLLLGKKHPNYKPELHIKKYCLCGCGTSVKRRFVNGHHGLGNKHAQGNKPNEHSFKKGHITWLKGKKSPYTTKRNLENNPSKLEHNRKRMQENNPSQLLHNRIRMSENCPARFCRSPSKPQKALYDKVKDLFLPYSAILNFKVQKKKGGNYYLDVAIPNLKINFEYDGKYWHSKPETILKDKIRDEYLTSQGWNIIRIGGK